MNKNQISRRVCGVNRQKLCIYSDLCAEVAAYSALFPPRVQPARCRRLGFVS
jgi:hypothetical protein